MSNVKTVEILKSEIDEAILPYVVQDIANLIGLADTLKLVDHFKGTVMRVPSQYKPEHMLCKIVGDKHAIRIIEQFKGSTLEIPKCEAALRYVRDKKIIASEKSQSQLAIEHNLTVRQIRNIQRGCGEDDRQEDLF